MRKFTTLMIALGLSLATGAAFAQNVNVTGTAMVQEGGQFVTANDANVSVGDTIMVPEGQTVTLTYPDGTRLAFTQGTYTVPTAAQAASMVGGESVYVSAGMTAAIVGGVVILTAALIDQNLDDDDAAPPVSP